MKKIIIGLLISALLIYFSFKGTNFRDVIEGMTNIGYGYILLYLLIMCLMQGLRAWRWGLILNPLEKIGYGLLFAITSVGFLAITAFPARLGELGRPYLVACKSAIKLPAALGTIFVERTLDGVTILAIASLTSFFTVLPLWLLKANVIFLGFNVVLLSAVFMAVFKQTTLWKLLNYVLRILPEKWENKLARLLQHFIDGFQIIADVKRFLPILFLSFIIWIINALAIYTLILAFKLAVPPIAAFVLMIILLVGIAIPAAPGFVGNWHFSVVLGLGLFDVAKTEALAFAIFYHFLAVGMVVVIGLIFLPTMKICLSDLSKAIKNT